MINDFLPQYLEVLNCSEKYQILRSILIDGHEVAWAEISYDNQIFRFRRAMLCECDFKFKYDRSGKPFKVVDLRHSCIYRDVARRLRRLELHQEYKDKFDSVWGIIDFEKYTEEILFDLIARVKNGEFIGEDPSGALFYGGYFYLQTFLDIIGWAGSGKSFIDTCLAPLLEQKKISFRGTIVCDYFDPEGEY